MRRFGIWVLFVISVCVPARSAEDYSAWLHSAKLHINTTATGAGVGTSHAHFPMLVRITDSRIFAQSMTDGADVRFADVDGTHLDFQVERWNRTLGKAEIWVRIPLVDSLSDKQYITVFWGKAGSAWLSDGSKTFKTDAGFTEVYHLSEGGTGVRSNSVGNSNHATPKSYDGNESVQGVIGMADSLDGTSVKDGDYLDLGAGFADLTSFTFNIWAYPTKPGTWERLIEFGNGEYNDNFVFARSNVSDTLVALGFGPKPAGGGGWPGGGETQGIDLGHTNVAKGLDLKKWGCYGVTVNGKNVTIFKNGVKAATGLLTQPMNKIARIGNFIGHSNWAVDAPFSGIVDEPQFVMGAHSPEWMKLTYENQRPDAKMFTWEFPPDIKLAITVQPVGVTAEEGKPVKFSVAAVSSGTLAYQWTKDGASLTGATGQSYTITAVTLEDMGMYACRVTDGKDTVMSKNAALFVPENLATWAHSQKIFINTTTIGINLAGDLANVPILVRLGKKTLDFSQVGAGGKDIRFAGSDGAVLVHAIERWGTDTAEVWVRLTKVLHNDDKGYITMYWGKAAAWQASSPGYVFSLNDGWRAYYGFNETASSGSDTRVLDATLNGFQGTGQGVSSVDAGAIGKGLTFTGSSHIEAPQPVTDGLTTFTVLAWAKEKTPAPAATDVRDNPSVYGIRTAVASQGEFGVYSKGGTLGAWEDILSSKSVQFAETDHDLHDGQWHQIAVTSTGSSFSLYCDGLFEFSKAGENLPLSPNVFGIGAVRTPAGVWSGGFTGDIDAVQILNEAKSPDWIKFENATQAPGSMVLSFGVPADLPPPAPVIDPPSGEYDGPLVIQITCAADSTRILYTLDGTEPDTVAHASTKNIGSNLSLSANGTVKAIAYRKGKASAVTTATYKIAAVINTAPNDTLKPGGEKFIDASHRVVYPNQDAKAPVLFSLGAAWNPLPTGFDKVGPLFQVSVIDTAAAFPGLRVEGDSLTGLSLFRRDPNHAILWMPPKDGQLWIPGAGSYFWGRDIQPPRIRLAGSGALGSDSLQARIIIEDNVSALQGKIRYWNGGQDSLGWWSSATGDVLEFTVPVPREPEIPLEVRFTATDQSTQSLFPSKGKLTLSRPLPAMSSPLGLKSGIKWKMAGLPLIADGSLTLKDLAAASGTGPLYAAVWRSHPAPDTGYLILKDKDVLPTGKGFWLASEGGVPGINIPASRAVASDSDGLFTLKLEAGWNLVTCPSFHPLAWPVSINDGDAYLRSPLKPLHGFADSGYTRPDSLRPWEAYYVYYERDTLVRVGPGAPRVTDLFPAPKTNAPGAAGVNARSLDIGFSVTGGIALDLGASAFARAGLGVEDEARPPVIDDRSDAWLAREGRALAVDYLAWDPTRAMAWSLRARGQPTGSAFTVSRAALPQGYEAWAVSPSRRLKWRLQPGGNIPVTGDDTLAVYVGTPDALAKVSDLRKGRLAAGEFSARLRAAGGGLELLLELPSAARLDVRLWNASGASLGGFSDRAFPSGSHALGWSALSGGRSPLSQGAYWMEIRARGPDWTLRRVFSQGLVH